MASALWRLDGVSLRGRYCRAGSPQDAIAQLDAVVRVIGRNDGGMAIRWNKGVLSGVVGSDTRQLMGVSQQIFSRHVVQDDGSFAVVYLEIVYFSDLKTGAVMEVWNNPYLGRWVRVPLQVLGPTRFQLLPSLEAVHPPFPLEGLAHRQWLEMHARVGDDVMLDERLESFIPPMQDGGAPLKFHEVFFHASQSALTNTSDPHVPATINKFYIISWRPWMEMGRHYGTTVSRGAGRVITNYENLPSDLIEHNACFHGDVIADLGDLLSL